LVCLGLSDFRWHSRIELAKRLLIPVEFIEDVCLFLGRYGFADCKGDSVKLHPDQPSVREAASIIRALASGATIRADVTVG